MTRFDKINETAFWAWLSLSLGVASPLAKTFADHIEDYERFFFEKDISFLNLPASNASVLKQKLDVVKIEKLIPKLEAFFEKGFSAVTPTSPNYSPNLRMLDNMPLILYSAGDATLIADSSAIAVVGTRRMSAYGKEAATQIGRGLAKCGILVVSGMALGIDAAAHRAALNAGGMTVAVLGGAIDRLYPKENAGLYEDIIKSGAVVSEYFPGTEPTRVSFPLRNRIISGLSRGVAIPQAHDRSGSLITVAFAVEQGKEVFVVPDQITTDAGKVAVRLIRQGAIAIESAYDILTEYDIAYDFFKHEKQPDMIVPEIAETKPANQIKTLLLEGDAALVYNILQNGEKSIDEIIRTNEKLDAARVATALTELEILGYIRACPGSRYIVN